MTNQFDKYRAHLDEMALTREQEDALLEALWCVVEHFVDVGLGSDAIHAASTHTQEDTGTVGRIEIRSVNPKKQKDKSRKRGPS